VAADDIDPVTRLKPSDQCEHLVRGQVEWMQGQTEGIVAHEREEPVGAVDRPLDEGPCLPLSQRSFDKSGQLADGADRETGALQESLVGPPCACGPARHAAFTFSDPA
jgi:hypothetical protein